MNLPTGTHTIKVEVDDYFRLVTEKSEQRNVVATGINDYTAPEYLKVYPNPTSGLTTLSYPEGSSAHISLYNASGSLLKQLVDDDQDGKTQLDVSDFPAGMIHYQIKLESQEANRTLTGSIVIEK